MEQPLAVPGYPLRSCESCMKLGLAADMRRNVEEDAGGLG